MDPRRFHEIAQEIAEVGDEAYSRTAVSRAYYAAFHVGRELFEKMNCPIPKTGGHNKLGMFLRNSGDREFSKAGGKLNNLRDQRVKADYHIDSTDFHKPKTIKVIVNQAAQIIEVLDSCPSCSERYQHIKQVVHNYRKTLQGS